MQALLSFLTDIFSQPAFLMGIIAFVGLVALRSPFNKLLTGTLKPILGYLMLSAGAGVIVSNLNPLGDIIEAGFNIRGVIPNNEAIVSVAQQMLGVETMSILLLGFIINLIIARFTKYKYIFLTGHHSFFLACLFSAVLQAAHFSGWWLIAIGGFLLGSWSAISPAIGQRYTKQVTDDGGIAMGHFGSLGYYLSAFIAKRVGNKADSFADTEISEKWGFLRDTTVTTGIIMVIIYLICSLVAGTQYMKTITELNPLIFSILCGLQFAVGVAIVYNGVRLILGDLVPAFQGISQKIIPDSIPAVDCAVFFTFSPTAVVVGFICSFIGGLVGMFILGGVGMALIIPGMVPHFFCGGTSGVFADKLGGKRGCIIASFIGGILLAFLPALLLPALGELGFQNSTFADFDFAVWGIVIGNLFTQFGQIAIYAICVVLLITLLLPFCFKSVKVVGDTKTLDELNKSSK
ncbi:PTS ascorbate transporter subunit IIC [Orbus sasakiae]|uniref:Ascorbate-specific PTS system EIIC component n=1 Tax=Orbus sasakiae TaxID=1078475 RepID=A0ABP9N5U4_9GAMM